MHTEEKQEWGGMLASRLLISLELLTAALVFLWLGLDAIRKRMFQARESLEGQGVLITNGETALATVLAQQLAAEGCKVGVVLPAAAHGQRTPPGTHALRATADTRAGADALVRDARALLGPVRVLVLAPPGAPADGSLAPPRAPAGGLGEVARAVDADLLENLHLAERTVSAMAGAGGGRVLAVARAAGDAYDGARAALADVVRAAAQHIADSSRGGASVRVSSVRVRSGVDTTRAAAALVAAIRDRRPRMLLPSARAYYGHLARMAMNKVKQSFVKAVWRRIKMLA